MKNTALRCPLLSILVIVATVAASVTEAASFERSDRPTTFMNGLLSRFQPVPEGQLKYILNEGTNVYFLRCFSNREPYHPFVMEMTTDTSLAKGELQYRIQHQDIDFFEFDRETNHEIEFLTKVAQGATLTVRTGRWGSVAAKKYGEVLHVRKAAGWHMQGLFEMQVTFVSKAGLIGRTMLLNMRYEGILNEIYAYCEELHGN